MFIPSIFLVLLLALETLGDCPQKCPNTYSPVCGNDGKTYSNECFLQVERDCKGKPHLKMRHPGPCKGIGINLLRSQPVQCDPSTKNGVCTKKYLALCGSNGRTYGNKCTFCYNKYKLEEQGYTLEMKHLGKCQPEDYCPPYSKKGMCTLEYAPVCATDGETYPSLCSMCAAMYRKQQQGEDVVLQVAYNGPCKTRKTMATEPFCDGKYTSGVCTMEFFPMCGSDGKTYGNKCVFCYAQYQKQQNGDELTFSHLGSCKEPRQLAMPTIECTEKDQAGACTKEYFPICGSDGKTYANRCTFCYSKFQQLENGYELVANHVGACSQEPICGPMSKMGACSRKYSPVCSNEGKTYANECLLCADLYKRQSNGENIHLHIAHQGPC